MTGLSGFTDPPPTPLCRLTGDSIVGIRGDCVTEGDTRPCGCACEMGDRGGK